jgi:N-acetylglucosamine kinase-like BadF-type ATPase
MSATLTIDGGGSNVRARLHSAAEAVTVAIREPLNVSSVSTAVAEERLSRLLDLLPGADVAAVSAGFAGAAVVGRAQPVATLLERRFPGARITVARDIDLVLAHLEGPGAALIVGTGAIVVAPVAGGGEVVVDGRGFAIADRGGGAWIGLEALRIGLRALDYTGVEPPLLRALRTRLGLDGDRGIAAALTLDGGLGAGRVAALAPVVLEAAEAGDPDAGAILTLAVDEVVANVRSALARAGAPADASVVVTGGVAGHPRYADALRRGLPMPLRWVDPLDARLQSPSEPA